MTVLATVSRILLLAVVGTVLFAFALMLITDDMAPGAPLN